MSMVHLPAVDTPQFDWCKTSLRRHPRPVPPVYRPEVAARQIVRSALDGRRSRIVGSWNRLLVAVDSLVPGVGNQYAALAAWDAQLTDRPIDADRPANLYEPADRDSDHGAHGIFGPEAGGVTDPGFLRGLPEAARQFAVALCRAARDRRRRPAAPAAGRPLDAVTMHRPATVRT